MPGGDSDVAAFHLNRRFIFAIIALTYNEVAK